jgi:hypothetical protein
VPTHAFHRRRAARLLAAAVAVGVLFAQTACADGETGPSMRSTAEAKAPPAAGSPRATASTRSLPAGRYVCHQGGLTSRGSAYWGFFDVAGDEYTPFSGTGGTYALHENDEVRFEGGIFERYEWIGLVRERDDGNLEVTLVEQADQAAFQAGEARGGGTGIVIRCGYDGTR